MSERLFGTDGVRGIANQDLTPDLCSRLAFAAAHTLFAQRPEQKRVLIGHDTRISADMLEAALVAGFTSAGVDVYLVGVVPTPGIAWLTTACACEMGVVISASHNSFEHNGIKIFNHEGYKLPDAVEDAIAASLDLYYDYRPKPLGASLGRVFCLPQAVDQYRQHLQGACQLDLKGVKIALDTANGAAYQLAPQIFSDLGADLTVLSDQPDGLNINACCGSTHVENLARRVLDQGLDLGLAFDGDADRLIAVDDQGQVLDGDVMLAIFAKDLLDQGKLAGEALVVTVMSNLGLSHMADREGIRLIKTQVGDRYVLEEMLKNGYILGGEQSGHMIFLDHATTGDGILSALKLLEVRQRTGRPLSDLRKIVDIYPQVLLNVEVDNALKAKAMLDPDVQKACRRVEESLGQEGRLLVRPSGTEPKIRIMLEGKDKDHIQELAESIARLISARFSY